MFHCTAATRADGKGANRNARLFLGVRNAPLKLSPGTVAVEVPDEIGTDPGDIVLPRHHGIGPMSGTQLDPMLRNLGVRTVVGVGVSVNVGVTNLVFDAVNLGYQVVVPRDAVAGVPPDYAQAVLDNTLHIVATLTTSAEVVARAGRAGSRAIAALLRLERVDPLLDEGHLGVRPLARVGRLDLERDEIDLGGSASFARRDAARRRHRARMTRCIRRAMERA